MLSRSVICYERQRNTASVTNTGFNYIFVSECKVKHFSTALVCCYCQKVFIKGRWYPATVQKWYAESKRLGNPAVVEKVSLGYRPRFI